LRRFLPWLGFAVALTLPASLQITSVLIGDPAIDVWNHAWGYWFVPNALLDGSLPLHTPLVGGPKGGVLYFIDTPGALAMLPISLLLGPAAAYNLALIGRIALAGLAGNLLAEELTGRGRHTWLAGVAYATTPFLLCELANGISEVCATQWLAFTVWAGVRAMRRGGRRDWALLGLLQGLTTVTTFYYGLVSALMVALMFAGWVVRHRDRALTALKGAALSAGVALTLMIPHWLVFRYSLAAERALVKRDMRLNMQLMAHNAVDPRIYITPGDFQSVDLAELYAEPFVHTAYLRWTVIALAALAAWRRPRLRRWMGLAAVCLVMGLGPFVWWGGDWLMLGGMMLSLPFDWIRRLLPQVAITHPLRLSLGAQILFAALAAGGAAVVLERIKDGRQQLAAALGLCALVAMEGMFGSSARWPLPRSDASVPDVFATAGEGMVLELPAEVGRGMKTSRYFWHQTVHERPIPYTPDVRAGSARDPAAFRTFVQRGDGGATTEAPRPPDAETAAHIAHFYGMIVLHPDFEAEAGITPSYRTALTSAFGAPEEVEGVLVWRP